MTNTYTDYPFTTNGINFISRIYSHSPFAGTISKMNPDVIAEMNIQAVTEMIGNASLFTHEELLAELERVNEGATHAYILLDEGSN